MLSEGREWVEIDTHIPIREITFEATLQTPVTNTLRLFAEDLSGVSALFYRNDAGAKINLSGGLTGSGVAGRVAFWTGTTILSSDAEFVYDSTLNKLTVTGEIDAVAPASAAALIVKGNLTTQLLAVSRPAAGRSEILIGEGGVDAAID